MKVDMHIHTQASDGSWSSEELLQKVIEGGIHLFAVTDHDTVTGLEYFFKKQQRDNVFFLPGVEICTTYNKQSYHILGYGITPYADELLKLLRHNTVLLEEKDDECINRLIKDGLPLDFEEYRQYQYERSRGGWKSLNFLIDKQLCTGVGDFFTRLFTVEKGITFPEFPSPATVISAIYAAGGIPVLAHPGSTFHGTDLEETLNFFAHQDIQGIECFHPSHDEETTKRALQWCRQKQMLITGGSDCHGTFVPGRYLGKPELVLEMLQLGSLVDKLVKI